MDKRLLILLWVIWVVVALVVLGPPLLSLVTLALVKGAGEGQLQISGPQAVDLIWLGAMTLALVVTGGILYRKSRTPKGGA
jgi:threonine/homoserine/homoserine lactone efflux protein